MTQISNDLTFIEDPGHGWLRIPLTDVAALGIQDEITACSFIDGEYAYLEEDCDYSIFYQACQDQGVSQPTITTEYVPYFDRSKPRFTKARFKQCLAQVITANPASTNRLGTNHDSC